jgi:hypothetical protein
MHCAITFTRLIEAVSVEVRSALPGHSYRSRLVGSLSGGAECNVISGSALDFYSQYAPAANELIEVHYRGTGRALARVANPASIAANQRGTNDGVYGGVRHVKLPQARTAVDCESAALALLEDGTVPAWSGHYETWSDFLPGATADIHPGDGLTINVPTRSAQFAAIVDAVEVSVRDLTGEHSSYLIKFLSAANSALAFGIGLTQVVNLPDIAAISNSSVGGTTLPDLTAAVITQVTSTTVSVDAGVNPSTGGIEVRWSDAGWGADNDRNLAGRFANQNITLPRLSRVQTCYLRQYDGSVPPKYSRYSTALHVDYPL